jgi:hypothetical protein
MEVFMPTSERGRRDLSFSRLDEVMPDVDRLMAGYRRVGNWSLGQMCNHLSNALSHTIEGFPVRAPWIVRMTIAPLVKRQIFRTGRMREGIKVPEAVLPKPDLDDRAEAEALRATLRLYADAAGPFVPHPFFGRLSREEWDRFHCIHCAHHLSFALPNGAG